MTITRIEPGKRYAQAVQAGEFVFLAGQVADDMNADATVQTREVLAAIDRLLAAAGSSRAQIVSVTIYLASMSDYAAMNAVWDAWVPQHAKPARATVEAKLADPKYRVEMQVIAMKALS